MRGQGFAVAALCLGLSAGVQLALLAAPMLTMHVFDGVLQSRNEDTLLALALGFILLTALGGLLRYLRARLVATAAEVAGQRLQRGAMVAALRGALAGERTRGLAALGDAAEVRRLLGGAVASDVFDLLTLPAVIGFLFLLHPHYGVLALAGCLLLALLGALADGTTRDLVRSASGEQARSTAALAGRLRSRDMTEGLGMLPDILRRWRPEGIAASDLADAAQRRARAIQGLAGLAGSLLQMAMVVLGAWLVARQEASPGSLLAATMLAGMAAAPVARLIATWRDWAFGLAAWRRLHGLIAATRPRPALPQDPSAPPGLCLRGFGCGTPDGTRVLVRDLSLHLPPGAVLGLRGANGVGKSSLLRAMLGLAPRDGEVRLDGNDLVEDSGLGAEIGYLPQGAQLLHGSVLDNIRRFGPAEPAAAVTAARAVGAHAALGRLPQGYETQAGPQGPLSGGQRQMVALARAFFGAPRLILLDEPEAGLDQPAIDALRAAVRAASARGAILMLVTHDPAAWAGIVTHWLDAGPDGAWRLHEARAAETVP